MSGLSLLRKTLKQVTKEQQNSKLIAIIKQKKFLPWEKLSDKNLLITGYTEIL